MSNLVRARSWYPKAWPVRIGDDFPVHEKTIATGQTIYKGDWVKLDASGNVIYADGTSTYLYGVALEDSSPSGAASTAGAKMRVAVAAVDAIFEMRNKDSVASSGLVPGKTADLFISGSGASRAPEIDGAAPVKNIFLIDELVADDDTTDTTNPGRARVKVIKSQYTGI